MMTTDKVKIIISDIHSHTYYSACGKDAPDEIIKAAIDGGIDVFGISDHHYGIGERIPQYLAEMGAARDKYADKIKILIGIEIATVPHLAFDSPEKLVGFDYCLLEHIDHPDSFVGRRLFDYRRDFQCHFGIAHTDLFSLAPVWGYTPLQFLSLLAKNDIFWEMNVNLDSIHSFREHPYVIEFMNSPEQQKIVRESGIRISVGFDGHRVYDYKPERVRNMCELLYSANIPMPEFITEA